MNQALNASTAGFTGSVNPATAEDIGGIAHTPLETMPEIFARARAAQQVWAGKSFAERAAHIDLMRRYIVDNAERLATVVSRDNGKTRIDALATEVLPCTLSCKWYARNAEKVLRRRSRTMGSMLFFNKRNSVEHLPLGVVGIISPWNYPLSIPFGEVIMGLMAGNAILLKVAAATPLVGKAIEEIVSAGQLPDGLFHHVVGSGGQVSTAFFRNGIDKLFFTGSTAAGKQLMAQAAETLTPLSLELGGKDAMLVMPDADLERATNGACWAGYQNAGQSCGGIERIYVHESIFEDFVRLLASKTRALRYGAELDFNVDIGAMTTEKQQQTVTRQVDDAIAQGAKLVAQGRRVGEHQGTFYPPTLMTDVTHDMSLMRDETFGPVMPVMKYRTLEEAVALANDCTMALTTSIWTRDVRAARELARQLDSGVTTINDHLYTHGQAEAPWGGWKDSGIGRTHGVEGLLEMSHAKCVNWDLMPAARNLWWYPQDQRLWRALLNALHFGNPRSVGDFLLASLRLTPYLLRKMFSRWKTGG